MDAPSAKIKEYIKLETNGLVTFDKFDELYYLFDRIIDIDVDIPKVAGIRERLTNAFLRLSKDVITRASVIDCYVAVTGCYESFAKKCLYLVDPGKYAELAADSKNTMPDYLNALGMEVFRKPKDRTKKSDCIFRTYSLRTVEAHECVKKSLREMYDDMAWVLASYFIITESQMEKIKGALLGRGIEEYKEFDISQFGKMPINDIFFLVRNGITHLPAAIRAIERPGHKIYFSEDGLRKMAISETSGKDHSSKCHYLYEYRFLKDGRVVSVTEICETEMVFQGKNISETNTITYNYSYDDDNMSRTCRYADCDGKQSTTIKMSYMPDGGFCFCFINEKLMDYIRKREKKYYFDNLGRMIKYEMTGDNGKHSESVWYYEDGKRMSKGTSEYVETLMVGNDEVIVHKKNAYDEGEILGKRLYQEGKLVCIKDFFKDKNTGEAMEGSTNVEYY